MNVKNNELMTSAGSDDKRCKESYKEDVPMRNNGVCELCYRSPTKSVREVCLTIGDVCARLNMLQRSSDICGMVHVFIS